MSVRTTITIGSEGLPVAVDNVATNTPVLVEVFAGMPGAPGAPGGAPVDASYLVLAANGTLTNERVFTPGTGLSVVDGGPGGKYTVTVDAVPGSVAWGDITGILSKQLDLQTALDSKLAGTDLGVTVQGWGSLLDQINGFSVDVGALIYGSSLDTLTVLVGQTSATRKFLTQTGDGVSASGVPAWVTIGTGDIPDLSGTYLPLTGGTVTGEVTFQSIATFQSGLQAGGGNEVIIDDLGNVSATKFSGSFVGDLIGNADTSTTISGITTSFASGNSFQLVRGTAQLIMTGGLGVQGLSVDGVSLGSAAASSTSAFQPATATLTSWGLITRASGFDTFTATPSSANLRSLLTDETGTGAAVFANTPTLVTPVLGVPTSGTLTNCTIPASQITGTTLAANVVTSSLTSVGILTGGSTGAGFTVALSVATLTGTLPAAQMPALTGDITTTVGTVATTLATVATSGTTGSSTAIPVITIDAKGRATSITTAAVIAPAGTLSGDTLKSTVLHSSLTDVGILTGLVVSGVITVGGNDIDSSVHPGSITIGAGLYASNVNVGAGTYTGAQFTGNAATVTTNANLTGDVTSVGNTTTLATVTVAKGGSGRTSTTAYAVICGGTTSTAAEQSIASVGTSGQVLTSNGAGALPTFQPAASGGVTSIATTSPISGGTITSTGTISLLVNVDHAFTAAQSITTTPAANTSNDGLILSDATAASSGNQQYSPRIRLTGQGWKTTSTAASQAADWTIENRPVQGTTNPTSLLVFSSQVNAGGYTTRAQINSAGQFIASDGTAAAPSVCFSSGQAMGLFYSSFPCISHGGTEIACFTSGNTTSNIKVTYGIGFVAGGSAPSGTSSDVILMRSSSGVCQILGASAVQGALICGQPTTGTIGVTVKAIASRTAQLMQFQTSAGGSLGSASGGCIGDVFADVSTTSVDGTFNTLRTDTTVANALIVNGDKILFDYTITTVSSATAARDIKLAFAGITIFDTTGLVFGANAGTVRVFGYITRATSTTARATIQFSPSGSATIVAFQSTNYVPEATLVGLTLTGTNALTLSAAASGTGAASGDIKLVQAQVSISGFGS